MLDKSPFFSYTYNDQRGVVDSGSQRGIASTQAYNFYRIDGLATPSTSSTYGLEQYDRIEVMSGVSGFMYGVDSNSGFLNYVIKRPTPMPYESLTVGAPDVESGYVHVDIGGPIRGSEFGYRINVVDQGGDSAVEHQSTHRYLVSGAFDYRPTDRLLVQIDASRTQFRESGVPPIWNNVFSGLAYPPPPDTSKLWSEPYTYVHTASTSASPRITWNATDWFSLRSSFRFTHTDYGNLSATNFLNSDGTYDHYITAEPNQKNYTYAGYAYADFKFNTSFIEHKLTVGTSANQNELFVNVDNFAGFDPGSPQDPFTSHFTLTYPMYIPNPNLVVGTMPYYESSRVIFRTYSIGDDIQFTSRWSALLGVSYTNIGDTDFDTTGAVTYGYDAHKVTPTYALRFKPVEWITTYASYIEGLQEGEIVDDPLATNNGAVLPPYLRKQYEVGAKATVDNTLLTLAYFDINSALEYVLNNSPQSDTYVQSGRQVSRGVEFSATGRPTDSLRILGGFMFAHSRVTKNEADPTFDGTIPQNAVTSQIKVTAEYDLSILPGFTVMGGVYRTGGVYADQANTLWVPGRTTGDTGLRYATIWGGHDVIARFNVSNVTNERFWLGAYTVGDPRRFNVSLQTIF